MPNTLIEFAERQAAFIERTAAEYRVALKADILLRLDYGHGDDCLRRSLTAAADTSYAHGISPSELRNEIEHPGSFRASFIARPQ